MLNERALGQSATSAGSRSVSLAVRAVLPDEPLDLVPLAPSAGVADDGEDRDTEVGQDVCAIAGHGACVLASAAHASSGEEYRRTKQGSLQVPPKATNVGDRSLTSP